MSMEEFIFNLKIGYLDVLSKKVSQFSLILRLSSGRRDICVYELVRKLYNLIFSYLK